MRYYLCLTGVLGILVLFLAACKPDDPVDAERTLREYIKDEGDPIIQLDTILAFATELVPRFMENTRHPMSVFFYPPENSTDFRYFETNRMTSNTNDLSTFYEKEFQLRPEFNGYLMRFLHDGIQFPRWGRISCKKDGQIHISPIIAINNMSDSTIHFPEPVFIDFSVPVEPRFSWFNDTVSGTSLYFQLISDESNDLISGTFTYDRYFHFYYLSNVIKNIRPVVPHPELSPGQAYTFTLMRLNQIQWVRFITDTTFQIPR